MTSKSDKSSASRARQAELFDRTEYPRIMEEDQSPLSGKARLKHAKRQQVQFVAACWDDLLPSDHQARIVWEFVQGLDLSPILCQVKAVEGAVGASRIDPRILLTLWLYATLRGIGSARELARRCGECGEVPFRWICGGVNVNYHTLSDFRTEQVEYLDSLLTHSVATLMYEGLVDLERVAQDGMRVRASAGSNSFHRKASLEDCLREAEAHLAVLRKELEGDQATASRRQQAAQQRAAEDRVGRIKAALAQMPEVEEKKKPKEKDKARVSTTDADARVMKMPGGGFRPAYNAQLATDTKSQIITGVDVTNNGGDRGELAKMVEQHQDRYDQVPNEYLADGGYASNDDIDKVSPDPDDEDNAGTTVYVPPRDMKNGSDPHQRRADESQAVGDWRERMGTDEAKEIYKDRAATAECVNAIARNRGLQQFTVRGQVKVRAVLLWYALAHNLIRAVTLRAMATEALKNTRTR
jgi:transposase